jgi:hypothetical protein
MAQGDEKAGKTAHVLGNDLPCLKKRRVRPETARKTVDNPVEKSPRRRRAGTASPSENLRETC